MINDAIVKDASDALEKQLREADADLAGARGPAKIRAKVRHNAIAAACNALRRFSRA